jgi:hypothetical protein
MIDYEVQVGNEPKNAGNEVFAKETKEWVARCG